jgi:hypothetical protein
LLGTGDLIRLTQPQIVSEILPFLPVPPLLGISSKRQQALESRSALVQVLLCHARIQLPAQLVRYFAVQNP